jgi:transcriptional regulator with XRE-family HTH domain
MGEIYVSKIAELRKKAGMTQRQLADVIGVDPSTIRNWERNRAFIETLARVSKLCEALDCETTDLYEVEDPMAEGKEQDYD